MMESEALENAGEPSLDQQQPPIEPLVDYLVGNSNEYLGLLQIAVALRLVIVLAVVFVALPFVAPDRPVFLLVPLSLYTLGESLVLFATPRDTRLSLRWLREWQQLEARRALKRTERSSEAPGAATAWTG